MKYILFLLPFLIGCDSIEDITYKGYNGLCNRQPESMSCIKHTDSGFTPSFQTISPIMYEMFDNFTYVTDSEQYGKQDYWLDNITTDKHLSGDCDDIALTFISQLILDGVNPSKIRYVVSGKNGEIEHNYAQVVLDSGEVFYFNKIDEYSDMLYMQYDNVGTFVRVNKWYSK